MLRVTSDVIRVGGGSERGIQVKGLDSKNKRNPRILNLNLGFQFVMKKYLSR